MRIIKALYCCGEISFSSIMENFFLSSVVEKLTSIPFTLFLRGLRPCALMEKLTSIWLKLFLLGYASEDVTSILFRTPFLYFLSDSRLQAFVVDIIFSMIYTTGILITYCGPDCVT